MNRVFYHVTRGAERKVKAYRQKLAQRQNPPGRFHAGFLQIKCLAALWHGMNIATLSRVCSKQENKAMTIMEARIGGSSGYALDIAKLRRLDIDPAHIRKADPADIIRREQLEEAAFKRAVNLQDHASQKIYATVEVNGKTVATLYNSGAMMTSNAGYGRVAELASVKDPQGSGPQLAQDRAEEIAKALGGHIVKGPDAMTPAAYRAVPPIQFKVDQAALENWRAQQRAAAEARQGTAQTLVQAQIIGQSPAAAADSTGTGESDERRRAAQEVIDEFLEFAEMSSAEKMRALILKNLGMTEEDVAALPPAEQRRLEEKIAALIREKMTGDRAQAEMES